MPPHLPAASAIFRAEGRSQQSCLGGGDRDSPSACFPSAALTPVLSGVAHTVRRMDNHEKRQLSRHPAWRELRQRDVHLPPLAPSEPPGTPVANTNGKWIDTRMSGLTGGWRKVLVYACMCSVCVIHWEVQSLFPYLPSPKPQPGLPLSLSVSPVKPSQT